MMPRTPSLPRYLRANGETILNDQQKKQRILVKRKTFRVIVAAVAAFFLSWTPYCFVSMASMFTGNPIMNPAVSLVPELMAKASVMYNPIVYLFLNSRYFKARFVVAMKQKRRWKTRSILVLPGKRRWNNNHKWKLDGNKNGKNGTFFFLPLPTLLPLCSCYLCLNVNQGPVVGKWVCSNNQELNS